MKKQTAVEWLAEEIMANPFRIENDRLWDKAKEMEKEQMESAYLAGESKDKQYYNETFKSE
jgi:hypothetical protein